MKKPITYEEIVAVREALKPFRWQAGTLIHDLRGQVYQVQLDGSWRKVKVPNE